MPENDVIERAHRDTQEGKSPRHKQASSFATRSNMCAKENTGCVLQSKQLLLDCRRPVERESACRRQKRTRALERYVAKPSAT